jgi:hypothetical protein
MGTKREKTDRAAARPRRTRHRAAKRVVQTDLFLLQAAPSPEGPNGPGSRLDRVADRRCAENDGAADQVGQGDRS